jgi:hypothetical protein
MQTHFSIIDRSKILICMVTKQKKIYNEYQKRKLSLKFSKEKLESFNLSKKET